MLWESIKPDEFPLSEVRANRCWSKRHKARNTMTV